MDATTQTDVGGHVVAVEGLLGRLLKSPNPAKPAGDDRSQFLPAFELQIHGIPIGWTPYRPADLTGKAPVWNEFVKNIGDIDAAPINIPMGPRHFTINALPIKY